MKKHLNIILIILLVITVLVGCSHKSLLKEQLISSEINKVQIVSAIGNPEYGADSKIIESPEEIRLLTETFNSAEIGNKVQENELGIGMTSSYSFFLGGKLIAKFDFNVNDSNIIWHNNNYYYVEYDKDLKTPYELYQNSKAEVVVLDENGIEMTRPEVELLAGYMVIKDNTVHFDEVEIITLKDVERIEELGLTEQSNFPNGYYIHNPDIEKHTYELTDETVYNFVDFHLIFVEDEDGNRAYTTTKKDEFLRHLDEYNLNHIPLSEQTIPYFIEVKDGKVIRITEEFTYTI